MHRLQEQVEWQLEYLTRHGLREIAGGLRGSRRSRTTRLCRTHRVMMRMMRMTHRRGIPRRRRHVLYRIERIHFGGGVGGGCGPTRAEQVVAERVVVASGATAAGSRRSSGQRRRLTLQVFALAIQLRLQLLQLHIRRVRGGGGASHARQLREELGNGVHPTAAHGLEARTRRPHERGEARAQPRHHQVAAATSAAELEGVAAARATIPAAARRVY